MGRIDTSCLVVVDVQGKLAQLMFDKEGIFQNIPRVIQGFKLLDIPILWCQQAPEVLGETVESVRLVLSQSSPINKTTFSCWLDSSFQTQFTALKRPDVFLCGIETHVCIYQTARDLLEEGFSVEVISDAVSSRSETNKLIALDRMRRLGVHLTSVEMCLFDLMQTAKHPKFKEISQLIR